MLTFANRFLGPFRLLAPLAVAMAALDGIIHLCMLRDDGALNIATFCQALAAAAFFYSLLVAAHALILWLLAVRLGGIRNGVAIGFAMLLVACFGIAALVLDTKYHSVMNDLWDARPIFVATGILAALLTAAVLTLLMARVLTPEKGPAVQRAVQALAFGLALGAVTGLLLRHFHAGASYFLPGIALAIAVAFALHFGLARSESLRTCCAVALWALCLLPLPFAVSWQSSARAISEFKPQTHAVKHVVLITIDTLRQDMVACCNPNTGITRNIDRIGNDGAVFENAYTNAPWTLPSLASLMTGLPYLVHGTNKADSVLPLQLTTIAETLSAAGYRTAGIGNNFFAQPRTNIDQGYQEYDWDPSPLFRVEAFDVGLAHWIWTLPMNMPADTDKLTDRATAWISTHRNEDFFLWLHYFDPHIPYSPPPAYRIGAAATGHTEFSNTSRVRQGTTAKTQAERDNIRALYEGEVRYVDDNAGRVLDTLQKLGLYEDALIIIASDHGEEFWEHDGMEHGHTLYNELLHVPLMIKAPKAPGKMRRSEIVSSASVPATIYDYCGVAPASTVALCPSLGPLLRGKPESFVATPLIAGAPLYYENKTCAIFDGKKYIHNDVTGGEELFDLVTDPAELHSIHRDQPALAQAGKDIINAAKAAAESARQTLGISDDSSLELKDEEKQALRAVGYAKLIIPGDVEAPL